jgi:hypothetical protein
MALEKQDLAYDKNVVEKYGLEWCAESGGELTMPKPGIGAMIALLEGGSSCYL